MSDDTWRPCINLISVITEYGLTIDWLEYTYTEKQITLILPLSTHARIKYTVEIQDFPLQALHPKGYNAWKGPDN